MRLPACAPLRIAAGGVPSITARETFEMAAKPGATTELTAALAVTSAVIVATVTIAVMFVVAIALAIAVKMVSVASAVIVAEPAVKIVLARSAKATVPVADTPVATAPKPAGKRAAIVGNVERVAANEAVMRATATAFGVELAAAGTERRRQCMPASAAEVIEELSTLGTARW
ncbi:MAG: hypothetical protein ABI895_42080 [Deltaproteobacteria bacterium]